MVAEMLETAAEFICMSMFARLVARAPAGLLSRPFPEFTLGGLVLTQSWTSKLTFGFWTRFVVFLEDGLEVMIIVGPAGSSEREFVDAGRVVGGK